MKNSSQPYSCWIITEGMIGTENQCLGVADALGISPEIKRVSLRQPWALLSPFLGLEQSWTFVPQLPTSWPDLLLTSGRKSIAAARYIKKQSGGKTFTVQIQDPRIDPAQFDLVAVAKHDKTRGDNVIVTDAAPNRITADGLEQAKNYFAPLFQHLDQPRVAVLIGGNSKTHTMTAELMTTLAEQLASLNASLMITASRRTGKENIDILQTSLKDKDHFFWDGEGENPYHGMLAWADFILVSADSVSMISDAATSGKPVYIIPMDGTSEKFKRFYDALHEKNIIRSFTGHLEHWTYYPLNDVAKIADAIKNHINKR